MVLPFLCAALEAPKDIEAALTPDVIARLEKGDIVTVKKGSKDAGGKSRGQGRAMVLINKPPAEVWKYLTDHEAYPEYMPRLISIEKYTVPQASGLHNEIGLRETVKIPFSKVQYFVIHTMDKDAFVVAWRLDATKQNDIKDTAGTWALRPYGPGNAKTIAVYSLTVDSGMYFPKFIEDFFMNQDLPAVPKALRKRVESGGTYKR